MPGLDPLQRRHLINFLAVLQPDCCHQTSPGMQRLASLTVVTLFRIFLFGSEMHFSMKRQNRLVL